MIELAGSMGSLRSAACLTMAILVASIGRGQSYDRHELTIGSQVEVGDLAGAIFALPAAGDYDGDGVLDLIVATLHQGKGVRFYRGTGFASGQRVLQGGVDLPLPAAAMTGIDWNGDALTDILFLDDGTAVGAGHQGISLRLCRGGNPPAFEPARALWQAPAPAALTDAQFLTAWVGPQAVAITVGGLDFADHWPSGHDHRSGNIGLWRGYDETGRWRGREGHAFLTRYRLARSLKRPAASPHGTTLSGEFSPLAGHLAASPIAIDVDRDGDADLVYANFIGNFFFARSADASGTTGFADPVTLFDTHGTRLCAPQCIVRGQAVDWDDDGWSDLLFGCEDGFVYVSLSAGKESQQPVFHPPFRVQQRRPPLDCGVAAAAAPCDLDADGDTDLLVGNAAGEVCLIFNAGSNERPAFRRPVRLEVDGQVFQIVAGYNGSIQGPGEARWGYTAISVADVDGDGDLDVLLSAVDGYHLCLLNSGTVKRPKWSRPTPFLLAGQRLRTVWRTRPVMVDCDADGSLDYVCQNQRGQIGIFPGRSGKAYNQLEDWTAWRFVDGTPIDPDANNGMEGRAKIALVDWDADGQMDLLVGVKGGTPWTERFDHKNLSYVFFLKGIRGGRRAVFARPRPIRLAGGGDIEVGDHTVCPATATLFGDQQPGLLLGIENGRIHYYHRRELSW
jgi:hypothetical protein